MKASINMHAIITDAIDGALTVEGLDLAKVNQAITRYTKETGAVDGPDIAAGYIIDNFSRSQLVSIIINSL